MEKYDGVGVGKIKYKIRGEGKIQCSIRWGKYNVVYDGENTM